MGKETSFSTHGENSMEQSLLESLYVGVVVEDKHGHLSYVNGEASRMLGFAKGELEDQDWTAIVPSDQVDIVQEANSRRREGRLDRYELELQRKDETRLPVLVSASPRFEGGHFIGSVAVFTDLTLQKLAEQANQDSERRFYNLFENAKDGIVYLDTNGIILEVNQAGEEIFGGMKKDLLGHKFIELSLFSKSDLPKLTNDCTAITVL